MPFNLIKSIFQSLEEATEEVKKANRAKNKPYARELILRQSLSCKKCSGYAAPVYATENRYRCMKCGNQFSGSRHKIDEKVWLISKNDGAALYKEAIEEMSKQ